MKLNWKATLIINRNDSKCFNCNKPAWPTDKSHDKVVGYNPGKGCGITWENVSTEYIGGEATEDAKIMRPDLVYIDYEDLLESI